ncbi:MAG: DUF1800 domain-containing protein [Pseudomonadota bacterium]
MKGERMSPSRSIPSGREADTTQTSLARHVLSRLGFGPTASDVARLEHLGFEHWLDQQLAPNDADDTECNARLQALRLRIHYPAGSSIPVGGGPAQTWAAVDEDRPLQYLNAPIEAAWPLRDNSSRPTPERLRPVEEVVQATILRAVHSRWQLREVMVGFWRDHFNVDGYGSYNFTVSIPCFDRDVLRTHCLGNFRGLLEATATSTAMLHYLSQQSSRAGAANENYARELFELHTLGRDAYLNDHYNRWRDVPGALDGRPIGYIDEDVYEAARAFTGWTVENGVRIDEATQLPDTGKFTYVERWHDGYQKRVLGVDFDPFAAPMADGRRVLNLVAGHPQTARNLSAKLVRRLVGDGASPSLVDAAAAEWTASAAAPDQIARVVRVICLSPDFRASSNAKVRRPFSIAASFARACDIDLVPTEGLSSVIKQAGEPIYDWTTPDGPPDRNPYWISANGMRLRWAIVFGLALNSWQNGEPVLAASDNPEAIAQDAATRILGDARPDEIAALSAAVSAAANDPNAKAQALALAAAGPRFQLA